MIVKWNNRRLESWQLSEVAREWAISLVGVSVKAKAVGLTGELNRALYYERANSPTIMPAPTTTRGRPTSPCDFDPGRGVISVAPALIPKETIQWL